MSKMKLVRRKSCKLTVVPGLEDLGAVRSFMADCLVPLLAEEFWRARHKLSSVENALDSGEATIDAIGKEDGPLTDLNHV